MDLMNRATSAKSATWRLGVKEAARVRVSKNLTRKLPETPGCCSGCCSNRTHPTFFVWVKFDWGRAAPVTVTNPICW